MAESFLEEQLQRIKEMTEQVSRLRPLRDTHEVRNQASDERSSAPDRTLPARRPSSRGSSRRRGR